VAITINHEGIAESDLDSTLAAVLYETGLPTCAPLQGGVESVVAALEPHVHMQAAREDEEPTDD